MTHEAKKRAGRRTHIAETSTDSALAGKRKAGHRNEIAIGGAVVLGVVLLFFGIRFLEDRPLLSGTYELETEFESADGLLKGAPVTVSGVAVGEVTAVRLQPRGHRVRVVLQIHDGVEIPEGSMTSIEGMAAFDNVKVAIAPGPPEGPLLKEGGMLPAKPTVPLDQRVDSTLAGAQTTFDQAESLLASTEDDLGIILAHMRTASGEVASLMQSERGRLHTTLVNLETTTTQLNQIASRLDHLTVQGRDSLGVAMAELNAMLRRLDRATGAVERGSADLETMLASINNGDGTLGRFVHDPSLYNRLDSVALRLDGILADFKRDPGRYLDKLTLVEVF